MEFKRKGYGYQRTDGKYFICRASGSVKVWDENDKCVDKLKTLKEAKEKYSK